MNVLICRRWLDVGQDGIGSNEPVHGYVRHVPHGWRRYASRHFLVLALLKISRLKCFDTLLASDALGVECVHTLIRDGKFLTPRWQETDKDLNAAGRVY